jgi:hypothetical protein
VATIVVKPYVNQPGDSDLKVSDSRRRELLGWLERHRDDIQNALAFLDDVEIAVTMEKS